MNYSTIELVEELFNLLAIIDSSGAMLEEEENLFLKLQAEWYTYHLPNLKGE